MMIWRDLGLVFDLTQQSELPIWYKSHAQAPNAVIFEDFVRVYFTGRPAPDEFGNYSSLGMFVDLDPEDNFRIIRLSQNPILDLGNPGSFDEHGTYPISVLKENEEFIAIYGGWSRCISVPFDVSLGIAFSRDGIRFNKKFPGPILTSFFDEPFVITSPKLRKFKDVYYLTYTAGIKWFIHQGRPEIIYKLRMATSTDLINWNRMGKNLIENVIGEDEAQACGDIFEKNGTYHMFFCFRDAINFRDSKAHSYRIGYAKSTDLITWERKDELVGFSTSKNGWDSEMCAYPNVFSFKNNIYMLYLGNGTGINGFGAKKLISGLE